MAADGNSATDLKTTRAKLDTDLVEVRDELAHVIAQLCLAQLPGQETGEIVEKVIGDLAIMHMQMGEARERMWKLRAADFADFEAPPNGS